jgi:hypothetical protein
MPRHKLKDDIESYSRRSFLRQMPSFERKRHATTASCHVYKLLGALALLLLVVWQMGSLLYSTNKKELRIEYGFVDE